MGKRSNVIYVTVNQDLTWYEHENAFIISEPQLLKKNIKPWKSKDGTKLMYQLYNPVTQSRVVYTMLKDQEQINDSQIPYKYYKFLPETEIEMAKQTELRITNIK